MTRGLFYGRVLASLASLMLVSWGLIDGLHLKENARLDWQHTLAEIATGDAAQLEAWLASLRNQTDRLAADPRTRHYLALNTEDPEILANAQRALVEFNVLFGAKFIYLFDVNDTLRLTLEGAPSLATDTLKAMATTFAAQQGVYQPLVRGSQAGYVGTAVAVVPQNGVPLGYVMAVYPQDAALERLGTPVAPSQGATRRLMRLDHQGRPQALRWPDNSLPEPPVALASTLAQWPETPSRLTPAWPAKPPFTDMDGSPVYAWRSAPLADGYWSTLVTATETLIYQNIPHYILLLALRTGAGVTMIWGGMMFCLWWLHKNPLQRGWQTLRRRMKALVENWRLRYKKSPSAAPSPAILGQQFEDEMFTNTPGYIPPPPLRLVEWPVDAPPTPERMAHFVRESLDHERIRLYYQPIVDIHTNKPVMFETLLRLADDKNRMVLPPDFMPAAKQFNLLQDIDDQVLMASIRKHAQLQQHGKLLTLSINLTETAFRNESFMHHFMEGVASKSINTAYLVFEVSSGSLLQDSTAMTFIREMQSMGCRFAIDYFGGGAKAVTATHTLRFDYMKINALRFADIETNTDAVRMFKEIIDAARTANLNVVVEKVETALMYRLCQKLGVQYAQGFFIAAPAAKFPL